MSGLLLVNSALGPTAVVEKLGFKKDQLILEVGQADDCDNLLRDEIQKITQTNLIAEEAQEVVDAVILWWREDDGDLIDELVDAQAYLKKDRFGYLLPKQVAKVMLNRQIFKMPHRPRD